jgi:class 3 adenylate cyclase
MIACPSCGFEAADDFAFCPKCATVLVAPRATPDERKVVTTLFCDLVGFTALCERADPEEVDALLRRYNEAARTVIEAHGGAVEKFIGDAVVGIFGVPAVHEDDPKRAVRAGLGIVRSIAELTRPDGGPLQARVGVNTGKALVRLDVAPGSGEGFLTGDAVNTAARLQGTAPPMGVVVGSLTHALTAEAFAYETLPPVSLKGKAQRVEAWLAREEVRETALRSVASSAAPMVGREHERQLRGDRSD